jgi:hypothetical protein
MPFSDSIESHTKASKVVSVILIVNMNDGAESKAALKVLVVLV